MQKLFDPVVVEIISLVNSQVKAAKAKGKSIDVRINCPYYFEPI